jgi:hypothetical protein
MESYITKALGEGIALGIWLMAYSLWLMARANMRNSRMWKDPVVEEVRAIRDAYAKRFNYNLEAIYRDLKEQEAKSGWEVVSLPPKRIEPEERAKPAPESEEAAPTSR